MNEKYLEMAAKRVPDTRVLINGISKRATQLARGAHPLIALTPGQDIEFLDIALREVAEGKIDIGSPYTDQQEAEAEAEEAQEEAVSA